jgi:ribonuclease-3
MSRAAPSDTYQRVEASIGHAFRDRELLATSLTHISAVASDRRGKSYQRLEFLGDRVLGLVISSMLYDAFPSAEEGEMSRRLAGLVRRETCAEIAREWKLGDALRLGDSEAKSGGRTKAAILSDVCEAVIGAVYVDAGFAAADAVVRTAWKSRMYSPDRPLWDPKTLLQEWAQGLGKPTPVYIETARHGPAHRPEFTVRVSVDGVGEAEGTGTSKRLAEQAAASAFSERYEIAGAAPGSGHLAA